MIFIEFSLSLILLNSEYGYYIFSYKNTNKHILTSERLVNFEWNVCQRFLQLYYAQYYLFRWKCNLFVTASDEQRHVDCSKMAEASPSLELAHVVSTYTI